MSRVKDKIALITGGSQGIGEETARLLSKEGAKVIITDILDKKGELVAKSINGEFCHLDVSSETQWQNLVNYINKKYNKIDILFNNAGIIGMNEKMGPQDPENASLESWHHVHAVNLDGVFLGCKYGIKLMKENGGSIINMSSRSGIVGIPAAAAYASSKAAIRNHTKTVALYCAQKKYNIRCNSIHPGAILTPLWDFMLGENEEERQIAINEIASGIPIGFMGEPIDVAYGVLYFASDESRYITGSELMIDGGILSGTSSGPKETKK